MEIFKRKSNYRSIIIITILIIFIITFITISYIYYQKYEKSLKNFKNLQENLENIKKEKLNNQNTYDDKSQKIEDLKNIDTIISDTKKEVFKLASELEQKIVNKETKYKIAYLTFDDGPYYLTDEYLKVLKKYKIKGTFFTIGLDKEKCYDNRSKDCSITYKKIVDNGHTIANHTYSHLIWQGLYSSPQAFINQVKKQENLIKEKTGVTTNIVRFPGGSATAGYLKNSIINELRKNNYGWVDWTAQDGDGGGVANTTVAWNNLTNSINEDIEVVLFHDYSYTTLSILPKAIEYLENKDYILLPLFYDSIKVNK